MTETLEGILLQRTKHSDRLDIATFFTRTRGRMAFVVPASSGRASSRRRAPLVPLSVVEITARIPRAGALSRPSSVSPLRLHPSLLSDPAKMAVGFFIRELLVKLLRDYPADPALFDFLDEALTALDAADAAETANFHIFFLSAIAEALGIRPSTAGHDLHGAYFDLRAASYATGAPLHSDILTGPDALLPVTLSGLTSSSASRLRLSRLDRQHIIQIQLRYLSIHFPGLGDLNSLPVLQDLFI